MSSVYYVDDRDASVQFASNGLKMQNARQAGMRRLNFGDKQGRPKGSRLYGKFSRNSALNLRRKLACLPSELFRLWGVTLTIPAQCYQGVEDFRRLWNVFTHDVSVHIRGVYGGSYSPDVGFVWRIELTSGQNEGQVKTPHLHLVAWTNAPSDVLQLVADWCSAVERHFGLKRGSLDCQVAGLATELTSCQAAFQYVANHNSKHKRDQLGWPGRQWGVFYGTRENRRRMAPILGRFDNVPVSEIRKIEDLNNEQVLVLTHGNAEIVKKWGNRHYGVCHP